MTTTVRAVALVTIVLLQAVAPGCSFSSDPEALIAKAQEYRKKADYRSAIIELKNLLQKNPENAEARYLLGVSYNDTGDFRSAEAELRRALERRFDPGKALPALGKSLLMTGQYKRVLDEVKFENNASDSVKAEVLTVRALASLALGHTEEAKGSLDEALAKQPGNADALLGKARVAAVEKNFDEALRLVEQAIARQPNNAEAWLMKGDLLRLKHDPSGAAVAYQKILEFDQGNVRARLKIASLDMAAGRSEAARKQLDAVRKLSPGNLMATYMQGLVELRDRNYSAARAAVQQVLRVAPDHIPSLIVAGAAESALGSHEQAQAHLRRVLERAPNNIFARRLLAGSLMRSGQSGKAVEVLQSALKQAPDDLSLLVLAGEIHMQNGEFDKAEEFFDKASKQDPKNVILRTRLGASRLAAGETESAVADLESAVQLDSEAYQADILLITSHIRQKKYDEALQAVSRLEEKQPKNPLTYNLKAAAYIGKRDNASARKYLEHALSLQATYVPAAVGLARLDLQDKKPQAARRRLEAILEKDKDNVAALLALAGLGTQMGATSKERIAWLERARKLSPRSVQAHLMLAGIYSHEGDRKKALGIVQEAHAINPENAQLVEALGAAQLAAGEKEQALQTFRRLVALRPKSPSALQQLARAELLNGNEAAAIAALKKAVATNPDYASAYFSLYEIELKAKRYPEAIKIARQIQAKSEKSPVGHALEGDVLMAERKFSEAAKAYEKGYSIARSGTLVVKIHTAYTRAGKTAEADARLAKWLKESPDDTVARLYAANVDLRRGRTREAITHYEWLQNKQPDNAFVLNNLAWAYHRAGDTRALDTAERAYKLKSDSAAVMDTLGWILTEQGNTQRGLELLQKAVATAPKAAEIRYHLSQAWIKAGDNSKGRAELEKLLSTPEQFPQRAEAQKQLEKLRR